MRIGLVLEGGAIRGMYTAGGYVVAVGNPCKVIKNLEM